MSGEVTGCWRARAVTLKDYEGIVGAKVIEEIMSLGERLRGRKVIHINSTRVGGGVAEILQRLIPLLNESGMEAEWQVITGDEEFFHVTKSFHNALHGMRVAITNKMLESYIRNNEENAKLLDLDDADFVVIHDLQPAALIEHFPKRRGKWIWRCHIDVSTPNPRVWEFLKHFISQYDAAVFHVEKFAKKDLLIRQFIIPPSIDPLSEKNREIPSETVGMVLEKFHINHEKPVICQIGRFDHLKDPEGVVKVYQQVKRPDAVIDIQRLIRGGELLDATQLGKRGIDCQLILAGGLAADDPEGQEVFRNVQKLVKGDRDAHILLLPAGADLEINALQRASSVVLQKSLKEGFALTVSEALWKGKPVIGGSAGGIPLQIINGVNGFLVNSIGEAAERARFLLKHPQKAREMGEVGREYVKRNFLITRHVRDYLMLYLTLELIPEKLVQV
ncbi:MAG: glycosyltransferase [Candidatus Bathyarchaeia archaeon]